MIDGGVIAIIRMQDSEKLLRIAEAIHAGGVNAVEVTMTTPGALSGIKALAGKMGDVLQVGVGSVVDVPTVHDAVRAGARYIVSPVFKAEIIQAAHQLDVPCMPGCFTPTEMWTAFEAGADIIKVFPADILGMSFIKGVKAPMPQLPLMPTGGIGPENAGAWIQAGACCVGVGSALLDRRAIDENDFDRLTENAAKLIESVRVGRERARLKIKD